MTRRVNKETVSCSFMIKCTGYGTSIGQDVFPNIPPRTPHFSTAPSKNVGFSDQPSKKNRVWIGKSNVLSIIRSKSPVLTVTCHASSMAETLNSIF